MKTILHVSDAPSIHTRRWAEHHRNSGLEVHVASFRPASIRGVQVHLLPDLGLGKAGYVAAVPALRALFRGVRPDIVHAQYVTSYGFIAALARLRPLVVTAWGTDVLISPRESVILRAIASYAVRRADAVTTVAEHMNAHVAALGIPLVSVEAVPFGVDTEMFRTRTETRRDGGPMRIVCTRGFEPIYDVATLLDAVARLDVGTRDWTLDLAGDGTLRGQLERHVSRLGLDRKVHFWGRVDPVRLASLLSDAEIFVTPSHSDGNNVSLNEAMACGCFPIATNIPANVQWLEHGHNGLLYTAGDANGLTDCLQRAFLDDDLRERARATNRRVVETRADWRHCVARMDGIYRSVIARVRGEAE